MADRDRIQAGDRVRVELIGTETTYTGQVQCVISYAVRVKLDGCPTMLAQTFGGPDWRVEVIEEEEMKDCPDCLIHPGQDRAVCVGCDGFVEGDRKVSLREVHPMDRAYRRGIVIGMLNRGATGVEAMWALVDDQGMTREEARIMVEGVLAQNEAKEKFDAAEREVRRQIRIKDQMVEQVQELEHLLNVAYIQRDQASRGWAVARERISSLEATLAEVRAELAIEIDRRAQGADNRRLMATEMILAGHSSRMIQGTLTQEFNMGWHEAGDLVAGLEHDLLGQGG